VNAGAVDAAEFGGDQADLLVRARAGERDAVDRLLRLHYDAVHAVCHRMVLSRESADDAVQNALLAIVRGLPRFDGRSSLSTWIYRIATNAAIDEIRRGRRAPSTADPIVLTATEAPHPDSDSTADLADHLDQSSAVAAALSKVPHDFRVTLVLRYVADLDYAEIAEVLGVAVGTVRSRLARGKEALAQHLTDPRTPVTGQIATGEPNLKSTTSNSTSEHT
jgi:RNA polymerase sigma-70 factor (ECF subfamily)